MEQGRTELSKDTRPIKGIYDESAGRVVGIDGVTKIVAYDEFGQGCYVPWFAVYRDDVISERIPAISWIVTYE